MYGEVLGTCLTLVAPVHVNRYVEKQGIGQGREGTAPHLPRRVDLNILELFPKDMPSSPHGPLEGLVGDKGLVRIRFIVSFFFWYTKCCFVYVN